MAGAGGLRERVRFEQRGLDANNQRLDDWDATDTALTRAAGFTFLQGGEPVMQQRLAGSQPVIVRVWDDVAVRAVDNAWRAVDTRTGKIYDIKSAAPAKNPLYRDMLAVEVKGGDGGG